MGTIHNPTIRTFHLPERGGFGSRVMLGPGELLDVPDAYLKALATEKTPGGKPTGWALRLEVKGKAATVRAPEGVAGAFAARIKAKRATKKRASADATKARLEALETEAAAKKKTEGAAKS